MRAKLLRLWRRPTAEKRLAVESLALAGLSIVALRLLGFRRWRRFLLATSSGRRTDTVRPSSEDLRIAQSYASVVDMVARNTPFDLVTCLPRSMTLWWLLRRRGVETDLHIGVRKDGDRLVAHAWVVCWGTAVGEREHEKFHAFESAILPRRPELVR